MGSDEIQYGYDYYFKKVKPNLISLQGTNYSQRNLENLFNWKTNKLYLKIKPQKS